jgi:hypothetical protein
MTENEFILWLIARTTDPWGLMLLAAAVFAPDVLTRVVNVHWDEGLAVEFHDKAE